MEENAQMMYLHTFDNVSHDEPCMFTWNVKQMSYNVCIYEREGDTSVKKNQGTFTVVRRFFKPHCNFTILYSPSSKMLR